MERREITDISQISRRPGPHRYVSAAAPGSRWDVSAEFRIERDAPSGAAPNNPAPGATGSKDAERAGAAAAAGGSLKGAAA